MSPAPDYQLTCPDCGAPMVLRETSKYKTKNGAARKFWGCSRYPDCKVCHGADPSGKPLGTPADKRTRRMRQKVHAAMDLYAARRGVDEDAVRAYLSEAFGGREGGFHVARLDFEECELALGLLDQGRTQ